MATPAIPGLDPSLADGFRLLDRAAAEIAELNRPVERDFGPDVISGSRLADSVGDFVARAGAEARAIAAEVEAVADDVLAELQQLGPAIASPGAG